MDSKKNIHNGPDIIVEPSANSSGNNLQINRTRWGAYFPVKSLPLEKPVITPQQFDLPLIERTVEILKYNILCLEYSISPGGGLRQWLRINISLFILLAIPVILFLPLVLFGVEKFATISEYLLVAVRNSIKIIGLSFAASIVIYLLFKARGVFPWLGGRLQDKIDGSTSDKNGINAFLGKFWKK